MPASADIYSNLALPGKGTGLATLGDLAELRAVREQRQAQAQKAQADAEKVAREQQQAQLIQSAVQKHTRPDGTIARTALLDDVMGIDIDAGQKLAASLSKMDLDASNARKGELDNEDKLWSQSARWLQPLNEKNGAALFPTIKARIGSLDPELAGMLGDTYDPERVKAIVGMGTDRSEYNKEYKAILDEKNDALTTAVKLLSIAKTPEHVQDAFEFAGHHDITDKLTELGFKPDDPATPQRAQAFIVGPDKTPPAVGSFEDYVTRKFGPSPTPANIEDARKKYAEEARAPQVTVNTGNGSDVAETVRGMKDGTLPPQLPGRASKEYLALMAEAHRQGFDLAGAATDWLATQKHINSLNGAQQLRLNQAVGQLPELLDSVDDLASKWKAGRFGPLNKLQLIAAKNGALGKQANSIATALEAQIADVTADLGAVYMGGNSPTDHALSLAAKALDSSWDEKVLHDMVALARKNVQTRQNSIRNTGVQGASADNPYAPTTSPTSPKLSAEELIKKYGGK